jgi:glyoxylase-like metal-dependent hydrolase (beta-lactamase superfamily II)
MLTQLAEGVLVHESECLQSNAVVVDGPSGVLLIDPGLTNDELTSIATDLRELGRPVVAGFSTHPHWDHVLWHAEFGDVPRFATARAAASVQEFLTQADWEAQIAEGLPPEIAGEVPMELLGLVTALPQGATRFSWDGPVIRIIEHQAHAPGHAALLVEERRVLVAGDMVSDVLIPMLDLYGAADPIGDYVAALQLFDGVAGDVDVVVPGHGSVAGAGELQVRIERDRAYVNDLREGRESSDARIGPDAKPGWEWVSYVHEGQLEHLAQGRGDAT